MLFEVVLIRLLLIVLLVLYHSFAIYNGAWEMPEGIIPVEGYWWVASLAYSFMLEAFVFISGYVLGFQTRTKYAGVLDFKTCVLKKCRRLMLPSIVFSVLYFLCFYDASDVSLGEGIYNIINGVGHMWFLPMLFLCFIFIYVVEKFKVSPNAVLLLSALAAFFSLGPLGDLPFRISSAMYYFLFFASGFYFQKGNISIERFARFRNIVFLFVLYVILFVLYNYLCECTKEVGQDVSFYARAFNVLITRIVRVLQAALGLFTCLTFVKYLIVNGLVKLSSAAIRISGYCFGVYLFQQFILSWCVDCPVLISALGPYAFPWVAFLLALGLSLLFTHLLLQTKPGRFLIG